MEGSWKSSMGSRMGNGHKEDPETVCASISQQPQTGVQWGAGGTPPRPAAYCCHVNMKVAELGMATADTEETFVFPGAPHYHEPQFTAEYITLDSQVARQVAEQAGCMLLYRNPEFGQVSWSSKFYRVT